MSIKLAQGLVDAVVAYLVVNLPTHLAAEQTLWNDGVALPAPNTYAKRDPDQPEKIANPPYLYAFVDSSQIYDWRPDYVMSEHSLVLWAVIQSNVSPDVLRTIVNRYGNALWKALVAYHASQGAYRMATPDAMAAGDIDVGPTLTDGSMAMLDVRLETRWTVREVA